MRVIKLRDNSTIFIDKDFDIDILLGSNKRFIKIGDMIINRADITAVVNKEQYDDMIKQSNKMVYTSQGWMSSREYANNGFLRIGIPDSLFVESDQKKLN